MDGKIREKLELLYEKLFLIGAMTLLAHFVFDKNSFGLLLLGMGGGFGIASFLLKKEINRLEKNKDSKS